MKQRIELLIIDPQNDFCKPDGALPVGGADEDMKRLATMISVHGRSLTDIHCTMDSHHVVDVAHPIFLVDSAGNHPKPMETIVTLDDVKKGVWRTTNPDLQARFVDYITQLDTNKRYALCVWNPHCLIGTPGHNICQPLRDELLEWETSRFRNVDYVTKGSNPFTEHYSAVQADVPDLTDPSTQLNHKLIETLEEADMILLAGEALDFCVANTVTDIADTFGDEHIKKMILLEDATSAIRPPGLENLADDFLVSMKGRGMRISKTTEIF